ncbi:MAG: serine hydrolase [Spirochaetes bacterium]|nr:serine hydrolase [Spirochaetota bacterium]
MKSAIDQVLENAVVRGVAPGVVALAADAEGVFYEGAFGRNGPRADAPMRLDAVFRIASMTKAVTTVAVMQLVEQGRLALDQPMREIAPELGEARVLLGFDADGTPRTRAPRREITLRHLLTHTSGYSYDIFNRDVARYMEHEGLPSIRSGRYAALRAPLLFDPGDRWEYGIGLDWVGRIVEIVGGKPLEVYMKDHILGPLGMRDTSFMLREDMESRLVSLMARGPGGGLSEVERRSPAEVDFNSGGSGLYSTGLDYVRFTRMLLGGGALDAVRVLAPQTVALMGQNAVGDIEVPAFKSDDPALARSSEQWPGQIKRWGLSFLLNTEDVKGGRGAGSMTWGGVYNTNFWIDPKRQLTAVLMMQILPSGDPQVVETLERYEQALYAGRR